MKQFKEMEEYIAETSAIVVAHITAPGKIQTMLDRALKELQPYLSDVCYYTNI